MIKLIIFDYDGVIVDSFYNVFDIYKIICEKLGKKFPENIEEFRKIYLRGYKQFQKKMGFSEDDEEKAEELYKNEILKKSPKIFEGIDLVIKELSKRYILTMVSASYKEEVISKLRGFKLDKYFKMVIGKEDTGREPLHKHMVFTKIMKEFNVKKEEILVIGDRMGDYTHAIEAGISKVIMVEYG